MSCIYGIRQMGYEDQGWIAHFIISSLQNKTIKIYGDGKQLRDVLYISDLINCYDSFINNPSNKVYNIGGGKLNTLSLLELVDLLEDILQKDIKIKFHGWRLGDQKVYVSDITKVSNELKWKPIISPEKGVKILVDWFKDFYSIQD